METPESRVEQCVVASLQKGTQANKDKDLLVRSPHCDEGLHPATETLAAAVP
jgi:hypothetical protein